MCLSSGDLFIILLTVSSFISCFCIHKRVIAGGPMTVPYACTLLEYCLVTGLDWWDLLVSLRPSMMDTVCERFTESFNRQLSYVQQFHYVQFLNIKTSLYRYVCTCSTSFFHLALKIQQFNLNMSPEFNSLQSISITTFEEDYENRNNLF